MNTNNINTFWVIVIIILILCLISSLANGNNINAFRPMPTLQAPARALLSGQALINTPVFSPPSLQVPSTNVPTLGTVSTAPSLRAQASRQQAITGVSEELNCQSLLNNGVECNANQYMLGENNKLGCLNTCWKNKLVGGEMEVGLAGYNTENCPLACETLAEVCNNSDLNAYYCE